MKNFRLSAFLRPHYSVIIFIASLWVLETLVPSVLDIMHQQFQGDKGSFACLSKRAVATWGGS